MFYFMENDKFWGCLKRGKMCVLNTSFISGHSGIECISRNAGIVIVRRYYDNVRTKRTKQLYICDGKLSGTLRRFIK